MPTTPATTATPAAPSSPPSPAALAGEAQTATTPRAQAPQAPRLQQTVTDEDLRNGALGAIKDIILGDPADSPPAEPETPGQDEEAVETPEIITADDGADTDDDGPDEKPDAESGEPEAAAEDTEQEPAEADEDLAALAGQSDEELDAQGKAKAWPASYLKRVKTFTRQLREAQAQAARAAELEQELAAIKQQAADPAESTRETPETAPPAAPSVPVGEEQAMVERLETLKKAIRRIDASPDGLEVDGRNFTPEQLAEIREGYQDQVEELRVNLTLHRREVQQRLAAEHAQVVRDYPWLKERSNPATAQVRAALTSFPVLRSIPEGVTMLVEAMEYRRLKSAGKLPTTQGTATTQPPKKPAPPARTPARPAAAPVGAPRGQVDLAASHKRVMQTGDPEDAKALLAKLL